MKKALLILFFFTSILGYSQRGDKIRAYKTAYITEKVELTPAEAEKFWPVYNKYDEELSKLHRQERREIFETVKGDLDALTEEQAQDLVKAIRELKQKEQQTHEALFDELLKILPAKKILKLKRAEEEFKRSLLNRFKNRRGDRERP